MSGICVIAPHPDDELLGAGGTLLKAVSEQISVYWLIITEMKEDHGYSPKQIEQRKIEVEHIGKSVPFDDVINLALPAGRLDMVSGDSVITGIKSALSKWKPHTIIVPWREDAHTDHMYVYDATIAATKSFRAPYVKTVLSMEILSETNFSRNPGFTPNWYVDISSYLERKIELIKTYTTEICRHPFPRSEESIKALATLRGSEMGVHYAEAFHLIRHYEK